MTLPIEYVVDVQVTREDLATGIAGFGILNVIGTSSVISPAERVRFYTTIQGVSNDFAETTEEHKAATAFFEQTPRAETLAISRRLTADVAGFAVSSPVTAAASAFIAVSDGSFAVSIDGDAQDIIAIDFTADLDFNDIAATIEAELQAVATGGYTLAEVEYDAAASTFVITSGTTGALSTVSLLSTVSPASGTDISDAAFMNMQTGKAIAGAAYSGSLTDELDAIENANSAWYSIVLTKELRDMDAEIIAVANWAEARIKFFWAVTNAVDTIDGGVTIDLASQLKALSFTRTNISYQSTLGEYPNSAAASIMLAVDYDGANTTKTLNLKTLAGITVDDLNTNAVTVLDNKNCSAYVRVGNAKNGVINPFVSDGEFLDVIIDTDWLVETIKAATFDVLAQTPTKIPYTDTGIEQLVNSGLRAPLRQAINNGFIAAQTDDEGSVIPAFTVTVPLVVDIPVPDRSARRVTGIQFTALLGGAIHFAKITGTLTLSI